MKVTIESTFHNGMTAVFVGLEEGKNYRKYTDCGDCLCGWPVRHVTISSPAGYTAEVEFTPDPREICIDLSRVKV